MRLFTFVAWAILLVSQNIFAEAMVESKLLDLKNTIEESEATSGSQPNFQVINACFYTIYDQWESRYLSILERTQLDNGKISSLNIYSKFAASVLQDENVLIAYYPNIFKKVELHINEHRQNGSWPPGPQGITLANLDNSNLAANLYACFTLGSDAKVKDALTPTDYTAGTQSLDDKVFVTFVSTQQGGIRLISKKNQRVQSDIPGMETNENDETHTTPIPGQD